MWCAYRYLIAIGSLGIEKFPSLDCQNLQPSTFSRRRRLLCQNFWYIDLIQQVTNMELDLTDAPSGSNEYFNGAVPIKRPRLDLATTDSDAAAIRRRKDAEKAYGRGKKIPLKNIRDKKLRGNLKSLEAKYKTAALRAKDAEILHENTGGFLEPETELERTYKVRQDEILADVPIETAKKGFELKLDALGPYVCDYTRNGRELLLAGRKGHIATMDWREGKLGCELQLGETVRDAKWLHNKQMFAVAQKKYVYIYDQAGVEVHCLKNHIEVTNMEFLPYHYLLATVVSKFWPQR